MEYFMKRRNLKWRVFSGLEYQRYVSWCHVRNVIPVEEDEFNQKISGVVESKVPVDDPVVPKSKPLDSKALNKKKKADLVELATESGITISGTETKKQIISLIIEASKNA